LLLLIVVGSFVPTYTPYILAAVSFLIAAVQMIGFYGVFKVSSVQNGQCKYSSGGPSEALGSERRDGVGRRQNAVE
jgi:hypothetical protein